MSIERDKKALLEKMRQRYAVFLNTEVWPVYRWCSPKFNEVLRRKYGKALEGQMNRKVGESPPTAPMGPASDYEHDNWRYPCETCREGRKCTKDRKAYSPCTEGCEPCEHLREMAPEWKRATSVKFRCDCDDDCYNTIYTNVSWDLYIEGTWHPEMRFSDVIERVQS